MKREKKQRVEVEQPDLEVTVSAGGVELACIAFFNAGATEWDALVGVSDTKNRDALVVALHAAAEAVEGAAFRPLPSTGYEGGDNPPPF